MRNSEHMEKALLTEPEPYYCWACGYAIPENNKAVFYTEDDRRAFVHKGQVLYGETLDFMPSECYVKAKRDNTLYQTSVMHSMEAEKRKGMLY